MSSDSPVEERVHRILSEDIERYKKVREDSHITYSEPGEGLTKIEIETRVPQKYRLADLETGDIWMFNKQGVPSHAGDVVILANVNTPELKNLLSQLSNIKESGDMVMDIKGQIESALDVSDLVYEVTQNLESGIVAAVLQAVEEIDLSEQDNLVEDAEQLINLVD